MELSAQKLYKLYEITYNELTYSGILLTWDEQEQNIKDIYERQVVCIDKLYQKLKKKINNENELLSTIIIMLLNKVENMESNCGIGIVTIHDFWKMVYVDYLDSQYKCKKQDQVLQFMYT